MGLPLYFTILYSILRCKYSLTSDPNCEVWFIDHGDVIISDANTPIFLGENTRFLPVECVYAVIEMKTSRTQKSVSKHQECSDSREEGLC